MKGRYGTQKICTYLMSLANYLSLEDSSRTRRQRTEASITRIVELCDYLILFQYPLVLEVGSGVGGLVCAVQGTALVTPNSYVCNLLYMYSLGTILSNKVHPQPVLETEFNCDSKC